MALPRPTLLAIAGALLSLISFTAMRTLGDPVGGRYPRARHRDARASRAAPRRRRRSRREARAGARAEPRVEDVPRRRRERARRRQGRRAPLHGEGCRRRPGDRPALLRALAARQRRAQPSAPGSPSSAATPASSRELGDHAGAVDRDRPAGPARRAPDRGLRRHAVPAAAGQGPACERGPHAPAARTGRPARSTRPSRARLRFPTSSTPA